MGPVASRAQLLHRHSGPVGYAAQQQGGRWLPGFGAESAPGACHSSPGRAHHLVPLGHWKTDPDPSLISSLRTDLMYSILALCLPSNNSQKLPQEHSSAADNGALSRQPGQEVGRRGEIRYHRRASATSRQRPRIHGTMDIRPDLC